MAEEAALDIWLVIGVAVAFLAGLLSLFLFSWLKRLSDEGRRSEARGTSMTGPERLEYYEKQLIDMKIRLDVLETVRDGSNDRPDGNALVANLARLLAQVSEEGRGVVSKEEEDKASGEVFDAVAATADDRPSPGVAHSNPIDYALQLITNGITTSRDIQITMKKSREHTSRLLKKMYEDGYLLRNEDNRPYTYSITPKGSERLGQNI